jgi:hypothetical protein
VAAARGGRHLTVQIPIENGVTIDVFDVVAAGPTLGRCIQMDTAGLDVDYLGIALVGGTGDAGGTVFATLAVAGKVTDTGAAFSQGPVFAPFGPGRPTNTAPSSLGGHTLRVGWAYSATEYILHVGEGVAGLAEKIVALFAAVGWDVHFLGLGRSVEDFALSAGDVTTWYDRSGNGNDAVQATPVNMPTYSATALNNLPGMVFTGNEWVLSADIDGAGYTACILTCLFRDTDVGIRYPCEWGRVAAGHRGIDMSVNPVLNAVKIESFNTGIGGSAAQTAAIYSMTDPAAVTGTWDAALATDQMEIRHGGAGATDSRPSNSNLLMVNLPYPVSWGARYNGTSRIVGAISVGILALGSTAIPVATVAAVEALIAEQWGL